MATFRSMLVLVVIIAIENVTCIIAMGEFSYIHVMPYHISEIQKSRIISAAQVLGTSDMVAVFLALISIAIATVIISPIRCSRRIKIWLVLSALISVLCVGLMMVPERYDVNLRQPSGRHP